MKDPVKLISATEDLLRVAVAELRAMPASPERDEQIRAGEALIARGDILRRQAEAQLVALAAIRDALSVVWGAGWQPDEAAKNILNAIIDAGLKVVRDPAW